MANSVDAHKLTVDTAGAADILSDRLMIIDVRWRGATTAGHIARLTDSADEVFWESVAGGPNNVEESHIARKVRRGVQGLRVPVLGSGVLDIYYDVICP